MNHFFTRTSRAVLMGLAWAVMWVPLGMILGPLIVGELEPEHIGGPLYAAFICGAVFAELAGVAGGLCRLNDVALLHAAFWGATAGALTGLLPFVLGDDGSYSAGRAVSIVAVCSSLTAMAAARRWLSGMSAVRTATIAAVVTGFFAGAMPWMHGTHDGIARFAPLAAMGAVSLLGAVSAIATAAAGRWFENEHTPQYLA